MFSSKLVGRLQGLCLIRHVKQQVEKENWLWDLFQTEEEEDYQDTEGESGLPTTTALQQLHQPTAFSLVKAVVGLQMKTSGTRRSGSTYQALGRVGKLPFLLEVSKGKAFSAFTFSLSAFPTSLHPRVKASHNNCASGNTCWSEFSCVFFLLS